MHSQDLLKVLLIGLFIFSVGCAEYPRHEQEGMVIGGILGGVLGSQIGEGSGKTAATIVGTMAGAMIGGAVGPSHPWTD